MRKTLRFLFSIILLSCLNTTFAEEVSDSVKIHFKQGSSVLDKTIMDNQKALDQIADSLRSSYSDSVYVLRRVEVVGGASPEGSVTLNKRLSESRAKVLFSYLSRYGELPDSLMTFRFIGRDWKGLISLVEHDKNLPFHDETLVLLHDIDDRCREGEHESDNNVGLLQRFKGGEPYRYMYRNLFPQLRYSQINLTYEKVLNPERRPQVMPLDTTISLPVVDVLQLQMPKIIPSARKPFYMGMKTNMLYDAMLVPNIGVEFYLGKNWTVGANWQYAWWKTDRHHYYWRTYGGEIYGRKWFGKAAKEKPMTGHHLGLYASLFTYDFEVGGKGQIGGVPGGTLWDEMNYMGGLEYGYSLPIARRFNIDFTLGVGYIGGKYYEYTPIDGHYVWQATKRRHFFGPTKLEVSLVWLIGYGNYNSKKGGRR